MVSRPIPPRMGTRRFKKSRNIISSIRVLTSWSWWTFKCLYVVEMRPRSIFAISSELKLQKYHSHLFAVLPLTKKRDTGQRHSKPVWMHFWRNRSSNPVCDAYLPQPRSSSEQTRLSRKTQFCKRWETLKNSLQGCTGLGVKCLEAAYINLDVDMMVASVCPEMEWAKQTRPQ